MARVGAGARDRKVTFQRQTRTQDQYGQEELIWTDLGTYSAEVTPLSGSERFIDEQHAAEQQVRVVVRYYEAIADLSPRDRMIYPSSPGDQTVFGPNVYNILAAAELYRKEDWEIIAARAPEPRA
jgi:SPP1 family predicted phage head-tail adaptor